MTRAKLRLAVAAVLFLGWIGYLAYLVAVSRHPVILSRPPFLVSNLYVVAKLTGDADKHPDKTIRIQEIIWAADEKDEPAKDADITVKLLDQVDAKQGWEGPDSYILPLMKLKDGY